MREGRRFAAGLGAVVICLAGLPGCATMRNNAPSPDLQPCSDAFIATRDGWQLGMRHIRPAVPDPNKLPVVLCHGLGLNATFWTITDNHLPAQLAARGYEVFLFDFRGSGNSSKVGRVGQINARLRQTPFLEVGEGRWTVDDIVHYDVPAVLDYVKQETGSDRVNWVGHSLGGMLMFPYLEQSPDAGRVASFVGMGSTITIANTPARDMLRANRGLRVLARALSPGRLGRPLMYVRFPGLDRIDQFYYTSENVDKQTVARFYGYTLEDTGRSALKQLDPYLEFGHFVSADRKTDYAVLLSSVTTPTLMIAGEADSMSDIPSTEQTYNALGSPDKLLMRFGKRDGQVADYGHCDLVWSRYAPQEIFPPLIDWLDRHQPIASPQELPSPQRR
ncbi:MAG: alpha/beta fold hydrolase [Isosphaeraceae bacterium]|nr:alpha/beta fold hydrolase [Isosphaeraceae bacterium]